MKIRPGVLAAAGGAALLALAVFSYGPWLLGADALDTDRATVLLMARAFAGGDGSVFFWQQNYMAALEPLLLTPLAALDVLTPTTASLVALGLTAALAGLSLHLVARTRGTAWATALLWALPPAVVVHHQLSLYGARLAATVLAVWAFALVLGADTRPKALRVGFLTGLAYFGDHLMLAWAAGIFLVAGRSGRLKSVAIGAAPVLVFDLVASLWAPTVHLSGPNDPGDWLMNPVRLVGVVLPQLFGMLFSRPPVPVFEAVPTVLPPGWTWAVLALPAAGVLIAAGLTLSRRDGTDAPYAAPASSPAASQGPTAGLLLTCAVAAGLFCFVGGGGDVWPVRYLVPLWPAVTVLVGSAVARWRPVRRPAVLLLVLPAVYSQLRDPSWPRQAQAQAARAEARAIRQAVVESGVQAVWADYWDVYRLALLVDADVPWATTRMLDRRPDWTEDAMAASPVAYLIRPHDRRILDLVGPAAQPHSAELVSTSEVAGYRLVVRRHSAPAARGAQEASPRLRFVAASVSPLFLFLGTLLVVGYGTSRLAPSSEKRTTHHPEE